MRQQRLSPGVPPWDEKDPHDDPDPSRDRGSCHVLRSLPPTEVIVTNRGHVTHPPLGHPGPPGIAPRG